MIMDDYRMRTYSRGPGWFAVLFISLSTSFAMSAALYWALVHGWIPSDLPVSQAKTQERGTLVKVPALVGLPAAVAGELLEGRGLHMLVKEKRPDPSIPLDAVVAQDPLPESSLTVDSSVGVVLSAGAEATSAVPALTGMSFADAKKALEDAGLVLGPVAGPEDGVVVAAQPAVGEKIAPGAMVGLTLEAAGIEVPKLVGLSWGKAKSTLEKAGFKIGKVRERFDEERDPWVILEQSVEPGQKLPEGSSIDLVRNESF